MNIPNLLEDVISGPGDTVLIGNETDYKNYLSTNNAGSMLNIMHLNIRSLQKNFDELVILINNFKNLDIIILSETFVLPEINYFSISGYSIHYNNAEFNKNDGTVIYTKKVWM